MDDERVRAFETELWFGGEDVYRERIAPDCLMVVPAEPFIFSAEQAIQTVADTPRWERVDLKDLRISRPEEGLIVIAYKANAARGEQAYKAYCTSTYRKDGDGAWQVVQHQQTVAPTA